MLRRKKKSRRPPCRICETTRYRKDPTTGAYVCINGHISTWYREELADQDMEDGGRGGGRGIALQKSSRSRKKNKRKQLALDLAASQQQDEVDRGAVSGIETTFNIFEAFQIGLDKHIDALIHLLKLPKEFKALIIDVWLLYITVSQLKYPFISENESAKDGDQKTIESDDEDPFQTANKQRQSQSTQDPTTTTTTSTTTFNADTQEQVDSSESDTYTDSEDSSSEDSEDEQKQQGVDDDIDINEEDIDMDMDLQDLTNPDGRNKAVLGALYSIPTSLSGKPATTRDEGVNKHDFGASFRPRAVYERLEASLLLAFLLFGCLYFKVPVVASDLELWAMEGKLPYLSWTTELPEQFRIRRDAIRRLAVNVVPSAKDIELSVIQLSSVLKVSFGISLPPLNWPLLLTRMLRDLLLPVEVYLPLSTFIQNIRVDLRYKKLRKFAYKDRPVPSPYVLLWSSCIVFLKMFYGLDGKGRYEMYCHSRNQVNNPLSTDDGDMMTVMKDMQTLNTSKSTEGYFLSLLPDFDTWIKEASKKWFRERHGMRGIKFRVEGMEGSVREEDIDGMSVEELKGYLKWVEETLIDDGNKHKAYADYEMATSTIPRVTTDNTPRATQNPTPQFPHYSTAPATNASAHNIGRQYVHYLNSDSEEYHDEYTRLVRLFSLWTGYDEGELFHGVRRVEHKLRVLLEGRGHDYRSQHIPWMNWWVTVDGSFNNGGSGGDGEARE